MRPILCIAVLACLLTAGLTPVHLAGQQKGGQQKSGRKASASEKMPLGITPEREAAVKTFVERNHPELVALLELLKVNEPQEYERAIRELHRVTEKLAQIQERDSQLYDLELQAWQVHSRIQLLTAKVKMAGSDMGDSDDVRRELKEALGEQVDARAALLSHERQRVADRLERLNKELARLEGDRQQVIERQFEALTKTSAVSKSKKGAAAKKSGTAARGEKAKRTPTTTSADKAIKSKSKP